MVTSRSLVKAHLLFIGGEQSAGCWAVSLEKIIEILADLCGSVHSSAARANLQSRESLVYDTWYQSIVEKC